MPPPSSIHHSSTSASCAHAPAINNHKSFCVDVWHQMTNVMAAFHRRQGWQQCQVTSPPTSPSLSLSPTLHFALICVATPLMFFFSSLPFPSSPCPLPSPPPLFTAASFTHHPPCFFFSSFVHFVL